MSIFISGKEGLPGFDLEQLKSCTTLGWKVEEICRLVSRVIVFIKCMHLLFTFI